MKSTSRFLFYWGPFLIYSALIFVLSSLSRVPGAERFPDKVLHVIEYGLYAFLLWRAMAQDAFRRLPLSRIGLLLTVGAAYGALDEYHQSFVPGRDASIRDWYADVAGILAMITFILIKNKHKEQATRVV